MRLGVIDIGSNTVHLLVVDAHPGAQPLPAFSHKTELRLSESLEADGRVSDATADRLVAFIRECLDVAEDQGVERPLRLRDVGAARGAERRGRHRRGCATRPASTSRP